MEKTYKVTIKTKRGYPMPNAARVRNAVFDAGISYEAIHNVEVEEIAKPKKPKVRVAYNGRLYALGQFSPNTGKDWLLRDFFNTKTKALNAVEKCKKNTAGIGMFKDDKFDVFMFDTDTKEWVLD